MLDKIMNKDKITSLELLEQINIFRNQEGTPKTNHKDLLIIIETEFTDINRKRTNGGVCPETRTLIKEQLNQEDIEVGEYTHPQNKQIYPMYILPLSKAKQCLLKESKFVRKRMIHYIEELENKLKQNTPAITEEQRLVLSIYAGGVEAIEATKALVELKTKELQKTIEYKEDVIIGLTDDIELKDKRQILNQVVRYKGANYQERWKKLYYEFEKFYHINLDVRIKNYNEKNKPKIKSKLDYIDKVMNKLPKLYEIASKLYEGDIEKIIAEYKEVI